MNAKKRNIVIAIIGVCIAGVLVVAGISAFGVRNTVDDQTATTATSPFSAKKETLYLWYTDEDMTDYLNSVAVAYNESHDVRVTPVLKTGKEFLKEVNDTSLQEEDATEEAPDMYLLTNDALEQATLAGLAATIQDDGQVVTIENYPQSAIDAVTYHDQIVAYPIYYDTSVLLYNKTYMEQYAKEQLEAIQAEATENESSTDESQETDEFSQEEIAAAVNEYLPTTIEGIESFANGYDAPDAVEGVFKWDVSNILYNYNFVGNYMNIGGSDGDDPDQIDIYNENTIKCLNVFQNLNQFFSIDVDTVNYDDVMQDFEDGKIVFTIAGTDAVQRLETAKENGTFEFDYGVTMLPDLNESLQSRGLAITTGLVINGYSEHKQEANEFAAYLASQANDEMYERAGKMSCNKNTQLSYDTMSVYQDEYASSVAMPKMMETSNLWMRLEIGFTDIWQGADTGDELKTISEEIKQQVTGESVTEDPITVETEETSDTETQASD